MRIRAGFSFLIWVFVIGFTALFARAADRPHIVLFIADDFSIEDCGPYGAKDVRTPNLDQLATQGMRFNRAFVASPTCTPSRSSIYTGLYPFRNGAHSNHSLINDQLRTLPAYMKELGYRVVLAGKTHIGPREAFPFEYLPKSNIMPPGKNHVLWTDLDTAAIDGLLASHDREKPLCLIVASHSPHVFWPEAKGYAPADVQLPPYLVDTPETRAARCRYYTDVTWMDQQVGELRSSLDKHGFGDRTLFLFTSDHGAQWPFGKWNLYDIGIHVPLIVTWPGHVKKATESSALISLVDLLPTLVDAAGGKAPKNLDGSSLLPTLQGQPHLHDAIFASHTGDREMNRSPMRCIRTDKYKYILNLAPQIVYKTHIDSAQGRDGRDYWDSWVKRAKTDPAAAAVIDRYQHRPAEELYEVEADPYEMKNLAADPEQATVLADLREKLKAWRLSQGEDLAKVPMPEDARKGNIPYAE